jgi:hypothetical protein
VKTWLRRLRAVVSIGAIWGCALALVGLATAPVYLIWLPSYVAPHLLVAAAVQWGVGGFVLGSGFAVVLMMMDGRKTFAELTRWRAALWGALAGVGLMLVLGLLVGNPIPLTGVLVSIGMVGAVAAGLGAGTVSLAKRAPAELETGSVRQNSRLLTDSDDR